MRPRADDMQREHLRTRIEQVLTRHRAQPFRWGCYDCATLIFDVVEAVTGRDVRPAGVRWASARGALGALRKVRAQSLGVFLSRDFAVDDGGLPRLGDLAEILAAPADPLSSPGVCVGSSIVFRTQVGWQVHPADLARRVWRID